MLIQATDLLDARMRIPPTLQIRQAMNGHLCRCGTYSAIIRAIKRAAARWRRGAYDEHISTRRKGLSRLNFLKASGALVIAFSLPLGMSRRRPCGRTRAPSGGRSHADRYLACRRAGWHGYDLHGQGRAGYGRYHGPGPDRGRGAGRLDDQVTLVIGATALTPTRVRPGAAMPSPPAVRRCGRWPPMRATRC